MTKSAKVAKSPETMEIEESSGNVFVDLDLPNAEVRLAKAQRARAIKHVIVARGWTQARAATAANLAPSDMSDMCRGKLAKFSLERLDGTLLALGVDIEVRLRPKSAEAGRGVLRVVECAAV